MSSSSPSIRTRLTRILLAGSGALLLAAGFGVQLVVSSGLTASFDQSLEAEARALVTLTKEDAEDGFEFDFTPEVMPGFQAAEDAHYFALWVDDELYEKSASLAGAELPREAWSPGGKSFRDVELPDGRAGRLVQIDFVPKYETEEQDALDEARRLSSLDEGVGSDPEELGEDPGSDEVDDAENEDEDEGGEVVSNHRSSLVVAIGRGPLDDTLTVLTTALVATGGVLMLLIVVLVRLAVSRGLEPLEEVGRQVARLDAASLDERLPTDRVPAEVSPLVERLNALFERLQEAFERERRFSADVAHELRTPVAELRNLAEVGGRWPGDPETAKAFFDDALGIAVQMESIVANLLSLVRVDAGHESLAVDDVAVSELMASVCNRHAAHARRRRVEIASELAADLVVRTDRTKLELVLSNLVDNAVSYSPEGETVTWGATAGRGGADIWVANVANGLEAADLGGMFDRFWRKDDARTARRHAGLGLSLVRSFAELLDVEVRPRLEDGVLRITLAGFESPGASL